MYEIEPILPKGIKVHPIDYCVERSKELESVFNGKEFTKNLSQDEVQFIQNERVACATNFNYWLRRYFYIKPKKQGGLTLFTPWESQILVLAKLEELERTCTNRLDGILIANLKARQLGASTIYEAVLSHRAFFTAGFNGLLAADVPSQSEYLFNMMERAYDNMPWYLKPSRKYHVKGAQMFFDQLDSLIIVQHGNQPDANLGRGKTIHAAHLSELETWTDTSQITSGLLGGALPPLPGTLAFFESTGKLIKSWWQDFFKAACAGRNRFSPLFIPWYAEPQTYRKPPPVNWIPDDITLKHAEAVEKTSPTWMLGRKIVLDKEQLYFWEFTRSEYQDRGELGVFFNEYCSDPSEAFRAANMSIFDYETMEWLRTNMSIPAAFTITGPKTDPLKILAEQNGLQEPNPF